MKNKNKHGSLWIVKQGQETNGLFLYHGTKEETQRNKYPLTTIESDTPEGTPNRITWESVRYFEKL